MMRVGNLEGEIPENICDLGFTITNSIKLLGFIIPNRGDITNVNCDLVKKNLEHDKVLEPFLLKFAGENYSLQNLTTTAIELYKHYSYA